MEELLYTGIITQNMNFYRHCFILPIYLYYLVFANLECKRLQLLNTEIVLKIPILKLHNFSSKPFYI